MFAAAAPFALSVQDKKTEDKFSDADLISAAQEQKVDLVRTILKSGVDVNAKTEYGATALFFACDRGNRELVKLLLDAGAEPNTTDTFYNSTPVDWAVQKGFNEIVVQLLKSGAKGADKFLVSAFTTGDAKLAKLIVDADVASNEALAKALTIAKRKNSEELLELLKDIDSRFQQHKNKRLILSEPS